MKKTIMSLFFLAIIGLSGCAEGSTSNAENGDEAMQVVATTTMIADLMEQIGGEHVEVEGLMGPGIDPHGYQASSSDVNRLSNADLVAYNGLHLEGQMGDVFANLEQQGKDVIVLEDAFSSEDILASEDESLTYDPHIWFSVQRWKVAADYVTAELSSLDPDNQEDYEANNDAYQEELDELDVYIKSRVEELPEDSRYLVTAHDAFNYFGEEYDFEVIGLQGLNTQTEAGTGDVSQLAQFIAENEIKAIFVESSVPTRTIDSLQAAVQNLGWDVAIGGELYSDALGDAENDAETYIKMYRANIDTIIDALN